MPDRKLPNSPQFQHSLGSASCWPLLMCLRHLPRSSAYRPDPSGPQRSLVQFRRHGNGVIGIFPSSLLRNRLTGASRNGRARLPGTGLVVDVARQLMERHLPALVVAGATGHPEVAMPWPRSSASCAAVQRHGSTRLAPSRATADDQMGNPEACNRTWIWALASGIQPQAGNQRLSAYSAC